MTLLELELSSRGTIGEFVCARRFGAQLRGNAIVLPPEVLTALEQLAVRNAVELVSYL